uniref:Uncharacterized protein n=1 Tax=Oryza glumipatula TaxID=40148 RepID=A0A0E0B9J1_9ORYZ
MITQIHYHLTRFTHRTTHQPRCPGSGLGLPGTGWKGREVALAPWPKEKGGRKQKREEEEEEAKKKKRRSGKGRERKEKGIREKSGGFSGIFEIFKENLGY